MQLSPFWPPLHHRLAGQPSTVVLHVTPSNRSPHVPAELSKSGIRVGALTGKHRHFQPSTVGPLFRLSPLLVSQFSLLDGVDTKIRAATNDDIYDDVLFIYQLTTASERKTLSSENQLHQRGVSTESTRGLQPNKHHHVIPTSPSDLAGYASLLSLPIEASLTFCRQAHRPSDPSRA